MTEGKYQIRVKGHLDSSWADWFDGWEMRLEKDGSTLLTKEVADQAALHGVIVKIRNLNLPLISVRYTDPEHEEDSRDSANKTK